MTLNDVVIKVKGFWHSHVACEEDMRKIVKGITGHCIKGEGHLSWQFMHVQRQQYFGCGFIGNHIHTGTSIKYTVFTANYATQ